MCCITLIWCILTYVSQEFMEAESEGHPLRKCKDRKNAVKENKSNESKLNQMNLKLQTCRTEDNQISEIKKIDLQTVILSKSLWTKDSLKHTTKKK